MLNDFSNPYRSTSMWRPTARFASGRGFLLGRPRIRTLLIAFVLSLALPCALAAQDFGKIVRQSGQSVVTILSYDASGSADRQGSGVFITSDGEILTNAHVVDGAYSVKIVSSMGEFSQATILFKNKLMDLALLKVQGSITPAVPEPEFLSYEVGDKVIAVGSPMGLQSTVSEGMISGIRELQNGIELIQTTAPISPGSSGGALLDSEGRLIGITTETIEGAQNINFALSLKTIDDFTIQYDSLKNAGAIQPIPLRKAGSSNWYSIAWKWVRSILLFLIALAFGPEFFLGIPLALFAIYLAFLIIVSVLKLISYPFKKLLEKRSANREILASERISASSSPFIDKSASLDQGVHLEHSDCRVPIEGRSYKPLVAVSDDEESLRFLLVSELSTEGYRAIGFSDKRELLQVLPSLMPDLITTDLKSPEMDGFELIEAVKNNPLTGHIPIIVISAYASAKNVTEVLRLGASDFISKPYEFDDVLESLRRVIELH